MWLSDRHPARRGRSGHLDSAPSSSNPGRPRPILVGVDGSVAGDRALAWAAVRAVAGDTSLVILHAARTRLWLDPLGMMPYCDLRPCEAAQRILDRAAACARVQGPHLPITTRLRGAEPSFALVEEGRAAALIVLGCSHDERGLGGLLPSVARRVARRARGRVVIVSPDNERLL
jgi:nucleotide-binding universal stress UspA family protein